MRDVARASGVSPATVSFILNETPGQSFPAATRERVRAAAAELGYRPHGPARALREGRSRVIVLRLGDLPPGPALDQFVAGMGDELAGRGFGLVVLPGDADSAHHAHTTGELRPHSIVDLGTVYAAGDDEADGGWTDGLAAHTLLQIRYLADRGHRRLAFAIPADAPTDGPLAVRRRRATEAAERLGLPPLLPLPLGPSAEQTRAALAELRVTHPSVTAVAAVDDEAALRVLAAMTDAGLVAPSDLAVIGFGDSVYGSLWRPTLTTVRVDGQAFGRRTARAVLGVRPEAPASAPATLVVRDTA